MKTWGKNDDKKHQNDKYRNLGYVAWGLSDDCRCWSADNDRDGFVPEDVARQKLAQHAKGSRLTKIAGELVEAGIWEVADGGWMIHDFLKYHLSRDEKLARRRHEADQKQARRDAARARAATPEPATEGGEDRTWIADGSHMDRTWIADSDAKPQVASTCPAPKKKSKKSTEETTSLLPLGPLGVVGTEIEKIKEVNAGTLVAAWIDYRHGVSPTPRILGQVSRELRTLLQAGIAPGVIYEGLINWQESGYAPSALSSFVDRALVQPSGVSAPKKIGSRTDQMATEALETLAWAREQDAKARGELA